MQNKQFRVSRNCAGVDYMLSPCETSFHKHRICQFASSQIYWMTLNNLWILKSQIWADIMMDLLPAIIETNGPKTASEDPNQRPEVEIYFHVVDNVIQLYFWMVWRRIRSLVWIHSRLAVGNWNMVIACWICKSKGRLNWLFTSRLLQCRNWVASLRRRFMVYESSGTQLYLTSAYCFVY